MSTLMPLFPLDLVLLPSALLPLHIFEPRYKEMVGECMAQKRQFGVVRATESGVAEIGCTAEITALVKKYDDGRMDIATEGRLRFEVMDVNRDRSFLQAEIMLLHDEPDAAEAQDVDRALALHSELLLMAGADALELDRVKSEPQLSYKLAGSLPFDPDFKQALLGINSERERLAGLIEFYENLLPKLRRTIKAKRKSGGNGHVV